MSDPSNGAAAGAAAGPARPAAGWTGPASDPSAHARAAGAAASELASAVWAVRDSRVPLVAALLTLLGVFLPWMSGASLTKLTGWALPTLVVIAIIAALTLHVVLPGRPAWAAIAAAALSFVIAVLATVVFAFVLVGAHFISSMTDNVAGPSVSIGGWLTVASSVVMFITCLRLLFARASTVRA